MARKFLQDQITEVLRIAKSALSRANEASGWDGKSVKKHVAAAMQMAGEALELAQAAHDDLATLRAEMLEGVAHTSGQPNE